MVGVQLPGANEPAGSNPEIGTEFRCPVMELIVKIPLGSGLFVVTSLPDADTAGPLESADRWYDHDQVKARAGVDIISTVPPRRAVPQECRTVVRAEGAGLLQRSAIVATFLSEMRLDLPRSMAYG
jgi:hypothetical protein